MFGGVFLIGSLSVLGVAGGEMLGLLDGIYIDPNDEWNGYASMLLSHFSFFILLLCIQMQHWLNKIISK